MCRTLDTNAVPAFRLGAIECLVGTHEQVLHRRDPRRGERRYSDACCHLQSGSVIDRERMHLDPLAYALGERDGTFLARFGEDDHELLTAVSGDEVDTSHFVLQQL